MINQYSNILNYCASATEIVVEKFAYFKWSGTGNPLVYACEAAYNGGVAVYNGGVWVWNQIFDECE